MPEELIDQLRRVLIIAEQKRVLSLLDQIRPQNASLADRLKAYAEHFEYEKILAVLPDS